MRWEGGRGGGGGGVGGEKHRGTEHTEGSDRQSCSAGNLPATGGHELHPVEGRMGNFSTDGLFSSLLKNEKRTNSRGVRCLTNRVFRVELALA